MLYYKTVINRKNSPYHIPSSHSLRLTIWRVCSFTVGCTDKRISVNQPRFPLTLIRARVAGVSLVSTSTHHKFPSNSVTRDR